MKVCSEKLRLLEVNQKDKAVDITERNYTGSIQPSNVSKGGVKLCRNKRILLVLVVVFFKYLSDMFIFVFSLIKFCFTYIFASC